MAANGPLPSAMVCRETDVRQIGLCRATLYAEYFALGKEGLCRVSFFAECNTRRIILMMMDGTHCMHTMHGASRSHVDLFKRRVRSGSNRIKIGPWIGLDILAHARFVHSVGSGWVGPCLLIRRLGSGFFGLGWIFWLWVRFFRDGTSFGSKITARSRLWIVAGKKLRCIDQIGSDQIFFGRVRSKLVEWGWRTRSGLSCAALHACLLLLPLQFQVPCFAKRIKAPPWPCLASTVLHGSACIHPSSSLGVFGWLQADTVAAVWTTAAAIHREKNTVEAAAAAGLQPQQAAEHFLLGMLNKLRDQPCTNSLLTFGKQSCMFDQNYNRGDSRHKLGKQTHRVCEYESLKATAHRKESEHNCIRPTEHKL
jgi:hypothetical protein